jgi:hypothetical protein
MLYKLKQTNSVFDSLEAMPFQSVPIEKHLENLLAKNLLDVLYEGNELMPILQERPQQEEADIYALDKHGNLVIFELKRDNAGGGAVHQALRYCESAAQWRYERLQEKLCKYADKQINLQTEHQTNFNLEHPLETSAFNTQQRLIIVGSASDNDLIENVEYWKSRGLFLDFIPYRIYQIQKESYFEFFSLPFDRHSNPALTKGVIFDTNFSWDTDAIWYMCDKGRVAAFGDQMGIVHYLNKNDVVFLYHKNQGIVAAGRVAGEVKADGDETLYRELKWLTATPTKDNLKAMAPSEIKAVLEHNFFWARTIKTPYLSKQESEKLLEALIQKIGPKKSP